ncbi:PiggyBac transposable element-derived protein 4 [Eumeta japonica]|uniref:PiggyBac transposable element-derived protein 4 n=1 Tax=Eumeta variegata TaxID=151549 RepID=A0A4C1V1L9_EUMVA|nr:PiggyBac transposable element-derived protein 4 [Eumeta japonica]
MISTFHDNSTYTGTSAGEECEKPICVKDCNTTMGGIDLKDQKLSMYPMERKRGLKWGALRLKLREVCGRRRNYFWVRVPVVRPDVKAHVSIHASRVTGSGS